MLVTAPRREVAIMLRQNNKANFPSPQTRGARAIGLQMRTTTSAQPRSRSHHASARERIEIEAPPPHRRPHCRRGGRGSGRQQAAIDAAAAAFSVATGSTAVVVVMRGADLHRHARRRLQSLHRRHLHRRPRSARVRQFDALTSQTGKFSKMGLSIVAAHPLWSGQVRIGTVGL